jgi:hypothetical protein
LRGRCAHPSSASWKRALNLRKSVRHEEDHEHERTLPTR